MKYDLHGKTVLLTGATGGIGAEIARILIEKYDCKVYGVGRNRQKAEEVKHSLSDKSASFIPVFVDLTNRDEYRIFDGIEKIDLLINNAGVMPPFTNAENVTENEYREIMETNFYAPIALVQTVLDKLKRSQNGGIVNICSSVALCPIPGTAAYCSAKNALKGYSEVLGVDSSLYVSTVYAGFTKTNLFEDSFFQDGLIAKMALPAKKTAKKIVKRISKGKKRIITGFDARMMQFLYKLMPIKGPRLIKKIFKKSGKSVFENL